MPPFCSTGSNRKSPERAIATAVAEIDRLEDALSLFRDDSELRRLNRDKMLHSPSGDIRRALALALDIAGRSGGLFDPSVQALWEAHVDWFAAAPDAGLPPEERSSPKHVRRSTGAGFGSDPTRSASERINASRSTVSARVMSPTGSQICCTCGV